jgi:hypothetical protein
MKLLIIWLGILGQNLKIFLEFKPFFAEAINNASNRAE